MAGILITAYLGVGALASAVIWAILIASKRRSNKAKGVGRARLEAPLFSEPNTNPAGTSRTEHA